MRFSIIGAGVLGLGLGVAVGYVAWAGSSDGAAAAGLDAEPERPLDAVEAPAVVEETRAEVDGSAGSGRGDPRFSEELLKHFRDSYDEGWRTVREDAPGSEQVALGEAEFRREVLVLPARLGRDHAEERRREEAFQRALAEGDGLAIVEFAAEGRYRPDPEDEELTLVDRCLDPRVASGAVAGEEWSAEDLRDGLTIVFGPGHHVLSTRELRNAAPTPLPKDVTIQGAGMDATLVVIEGISVRSEVERLRFRDLTFDTGNDYAFDLRRGAALLDFERVRMVRFDMGAGGSVAFAVGRGMMLRARDCHILGGYGRSPGSGNLFRGAALIARFERCRFDLLDMTLDEVEGGEVLFLHCTFDRMRADPTREASPRIRFVGCRVGDLRTSALVPPEDVGALVPGG